MDAMLSKEDQKRQRRKIRYLANIESEREKARTRARRNKQALRDPDEIKRRKECHRQAQARYRAANRAQLRTQAWQHRLKAKREKTREKELQGDEEEYQALMAQVLEDEDNEFEAKREKTCEKELQGVEDEDS
ncbi:hypothetical protein GALMADRAFT_133565 [Galerina marginata CBS 339.88]|uniref:BZIP domain-containing protein n=1 Tax=Galerina marginata (strain CBS 339.88) TaxID=685588 RepID=A0A067TLV9_GALM3|nr:hypothetical protein GALMADRAFT_133565 [Galerina marginata CBS 339.88]